MDKSDGSLPTYEESLNAPFDAPASKLPTGQRILDNITVSRSQNISLVASQSIIPEVDKRARDGLGSSFMILLPSDAVRSDERSTDYDFGDSAPKLEALGLPEDQEALIIQLNGNTNRSSFWRQPGVIEELERVLKEQLSTSSGVEGTVSRPTVNEVDEDGSTKKQKKGLFGRFSTRLSSASGSMSTADTPQSKMMQVPLRVEVRLEDVCLRTTSSFGLFETVNIQAIVVRIDVRC